MPADLVVLLEPDAHHDLSLACYHEPFSFQDFTRAGSVKLLCVAVLQGNPGRVRTGSIPTIFGQLCEGSAMS